MFLLQKNTASKIVCTLNENKTAGVSLFLFRFKSILTNDTIEILVNASDDLSQYPNRYNEFTIDTVTHFGAFPEGFYTYEVLEMQDETTVANSVPIERGRAFLKDDAAHNFEQYRKQPSTFKVYNGN